MQRRREGGQGGYWVARQARLNKVQGYASRNPQQRVRAVGDSAPSGYKFGPVTNSGVAANPVVCRIKSSV